MKRPLLRPAENVQKLLISTTSRFVDIFKQDGFLVAHASPGFRDRTAWMRMSEGPLSRSAYVVSFATSPMEKKPGLIIPTYDGTGELVCAYFSLLFGKRFDFHGALESSGFFGLPDLAAFGTLCSPTLPQNSHAPRADYPIALNLSEVSRLAPLLFGGEGLDSRQLHTFQGAAKFYWRALLAAESDPEAAFLNLVTAGEILANGREFDLHQMLDAKARNYMARIEQALPDGSDVVKYFSGSMRRIRRRFVLTLAALVDREFFDRGEAKAPYARLAKGDFLKRIGAAYDLRSVFLHSGQSFGSVIAPRGPTNDEVQSGESMVPDRKFAKAIDASPTYIGLERILRYALLRFGEESGLVLSRPHPDSTELSSSR